MQWFRPRAFIKTINTFWDFVALTHFRKRKPKIWRFFGKNQKTKWKHRRLKNALRVSVLSIRWCEGVIHAAASMFFVYIASKSEKKNPFIVKSKTCRACKRVQIQILCRFLLSLFLKETPKNDKINTNCLVATWSALPFDGVWLTNFSVDSYLLIEFDGECLRGNEQILIVGNCR